MKMFKLFKPTQRVKGLLLKHHYCKITKEKLLANGILSITEEYNVTDQLTKALETLPILLHYPPYTWERTLRTLYNHGFQASDIVPMIVAYPDLLYCKQTQFDHALSLWRNCQFGEEQLKKMLLHVPQLLEVGETNVLNRIPKLEVVVGTKKNVSKLLIKSPNIIFESWDHVEYKIEYLMQTMRVAVHEIVKSSALSRTLSQIKCRHIFLERLGIYEPRKLKVDSNLSSKNPHLTDITDTTDYQFAKNVANITFEEFTVFKELYQKEFDDKEYSDFDDDYDIDRV